MTTITTPTTFEQTSSGTIDYSLNWSAFLDSANGEIITNSSWQVDGMTIESQTNTAETTTVVLSGGFVGNSYVVSNTITTNSAPPNVVVRSFLVKITEPIWAG